MIIRYNSPYAVGTVLLLLLPLVAAFGFSPSDNSLVISKPDEIKAEFKDVVCQNDKRQAAVKALFEKMGATAADITVEDRDSVENVVIRKPGTTAETILVGAHYDKTPEGCGAVDNWSGVVALAHVYRSLRNVKTQKTLLFVAFGRKEEGLIGSRSMAKAMSKEQAAGMCAMINLDGFGLGTPQATTNHSSQKLLELGATIAKRLQMPFGTMAIDRWDYDSTPFMAQKIPAIALHGLAGDVKNILHTENDKTEKVDPFNVYLAYRLALGMVIEINNTPCGQWR